MAVVHQAHVGELAHVQATRTELADGARRLEAEAQNYVRTNSLELRTEYENQISRFQNLGLTECEDYLSEARTHAGNCPAPGGGAETKMRVLPRV